MNTLKNIVEFETVAGYKTVELHHADLTQWEGVYDLLVVSAEIGGYYPHPHSLIGHLYNSLNINVSTLSQSPDLDFRRQMNIWISKELTNQKFKRIICLEGMLSFDSEKSIKDAFINLFSFLSLLDYHGIKIKTIAMPLLGSGVQALAVQDVIPIMMQHFKKALETNLSLKKIYLVEKNAHKVDYLLEGLNTYLKKEDFDLTVIGKVNTDEILINKLISNLLILQKNEFVYKKDETTNAIIFRLKTNDLRLYEFGILCRKFLELTICEIIGINEFNNYRNLRDRIDALGITKNISRWIVGYFHIIRDIGNSAAHSGAGKIKIAIPNSIGKNDIQAMIVILTCIVDFLNSSLHHIK